ncbi:hypothetical protein NLJ89_g8287 [Agrocybe chaxingu]|uniref:Uncharacterized protein n=1 Tax=Agrocybe chaxingu TaxID=84603 RepID=A0A9W8JVN4_9AGAR|nr:hypothetical protein NLJ89_g8287 [Agrocybe chaxingu]
MSAGAKRTPHVVIVGAGLAGISAAIALKTRLGFEHFTIYEQADSVGGTWRGCGSDVPGHWYSLSTDLNPYWQTYYADQPELRAYWENLWHKYDLVRHTVLNTTVLRAEWSNDMQRYAVTLQDVKTQEKREVLAEVMFYAIGGFQAPLYPKDITGIEKFKGEVFHSARWRHDVILKNKRVGVIGNGCSAAQFVPEISEDPSVEVVNFCRTPQWYVPRMNYRYSDFLQWIFAHVPFVMRLYRNWIMLRSDLMFLLFRKDNKAVIKVAKKYLSAYIKSKAPKEEVERLVPDFSPGCKRIIVDPGYLDSLNQPNVSLKWDPIESIVEDGIKLKTGEIVPLDVIIFGTGYLLDAGQQDVLGSKGGTILEYYANKGGAMAYLGACIPGFPNLFNLLGPNVATGHASVIFSEEAQINYAMQVIKPVLEGKAKSFEITEEATDKYNDWLQKRLKDSVWTECTSYYQANRDDKTRIIATFPGPVALFWWFCRRPKWELFRAVGAQAWQQERKISRAKKWGTLTLLLVLVVGLRFWLNAPLQGILPAVVERVRLAWSVLL